MAANGDDDVSLRPTVLKGALGSANAFAGFGKGAGFGIKSKQSTLSSLGAFEDRPRKDGPRVKYSKELLLQFMDRHTSCPAELVGREAEIVIQVEAEKEATRSALQKVADDSDVRDWRMRTDVMPIPATGMDGASVRSSAPEPAAPAASAPARVARSAAAAPPAAQQAELSFSALPASAGAQEGGARPQIVQQPRSAAAPQPQQQQQQQQASQSSSGNAPVVPLSQQATQSMQKASDLGREAFKIGTAAATATTLSSDDRNIRSVKGILNKLTPEKFDRLLEQLLAVITTSDVLQRTIALVFENAVAQPTFCAMYADLCTQLAQELPSFPPPAGADKPLAFRQILLNTCQDEFEGTEAIRQTLSSLGSQEERDLAERKVKTRTLGNVRLIGELYKKDMVKDWIMISVMEDLLGRNQAGKALPSEDRIEVACEMLSTAGAKLGKSDKPETRRKFDDVFRLLGKLAEERSFPVRIRFLIKDVNDLKRAAFVPRREVFTAKKLDEIRGQAEAELGIISSSIAASLPSLPGVGPLPGLGGNAKSGGDAEFMLLPPLRGGGDAWSFSAKDPLAPKSFTGRSAMEGDWQPLPQRSLAPPPAPAPRSSIAAPAASRPVAAKGVTFGGAALTEEELERKVQNMGNEFVTIGDKNEALTTARELVSPTNAASIVQIVFQQIFDSLKPKDQDALAEMLLHFQAEGALSTADLTSGLRMFTECLDDISIDTPKAPTLLGSFLGAAAHSGAVPLASLPEFLEGEISAENKRTVVAAALHVLRTKAGSDEALTAACSAAGLKLTVLLAADPEMDKGLPTVAEFMLAEKLSAVQL